MQTRSPMTGRSGLQMGGSTRLFKIAFASRITHKRKPGNRDLTRLEKSDSSRDFFSCLDFVGDRGDFFEFFDFR